jgi:hypothetical protein
MAPQVDGSVELAFDLYACPIVQVFHSADSASAARGLNSWPQRQHLRQGGPCFGTE